MLNSGYPTKFWEYGYQGEEQGLARRAPGLGIFANRHSNA
jgi:hypothetical protein